MIFLSDCFSMGYPNEAPGIGQLSGNFGVMDQELRSEQGWDIRSRAARHHLFYAERSICYGLA